MSRSYKQAMHAVQTAIAFEIAMEGEEKAGANPKHLRVGINSAMITDFAIANLLIKKGIITQEEYEEAVTEAANKEVDMLQKRLKDKYGLTTTLY